MSFPLIPLLIGVGVGVVVMVGGGKRRKPLVAPQYRWDTDNLAVPLNPSAILQIDKWMPTPLVSVAAGPSITFEMIDQQGYGEEMGEIAHVTYNVNFLWVPDWNISRQALRKVMSGAVDDPLKGWIIYSVPDWTNTSMKTLGVDASPEQFGEAITEAASRAEELA